MKTVPTVRFADMTDAAGLPDLPEEVRLAMTDIAGAAREGLLAMSVAAGMAVMAVMFDAEIAQACGPKGKHEPGRAAVRHGAGSGSVTLGGRRVPVDRPRARTVDGHEVPLSSYSHFAADDMLTQVVMERMLAGVATRRHARVAEPVGTQVDKEAKSTSRSAISRRFVKQTATALGELMARDLAGEDIKKCSCSMGSTWPSGAWWSRWPSPPTARRNRSGCGTAPPRTRPWCAPCWPTWSSAA
jgi:hypothetical protein